MLRLQWPLWMGRRWQCFPALTGRRQTFCWRTLEPAEDALIHLWTPRPHFLFPLHHLLPHTAEWPLRRALLIGARRSRVAGGGRAPSLSIRASFERGITGGRRLRRMYINNEKQHRGRHDETLELSRFQSTRLPVSENTGSGFLLQLWTSSLSRPPLDLLSALVSATVLEPTVFMCGAVLKSSLQRCLGHFFFFPSNWTNQNN